MAFWISFFLGLALCRIIDLPGNEMVLWAPFITRVLIGTYIFWFPIHWGLKSIGLIGKEEEDS